MGMRFIVGHFYQKRNGELARFVCDARKFADRKQYRYVTPLLFVNRDGAWFHTYPNGLLHHRCTRFKDKDDIMRRLPLCRSWRHKPK